MTFVKKFVLIFLPAWALFFSLSCSNSTEPIETNNPELITAITSYGEFTGSIDPRDWDERNYDQFKITKDYWIYHPQQYFFGNRYKSDTIIVTRYTMFTQIYNSSDKPLRIILAASSPFFVSDDSVLVPPGKDYKFEVYCDTTLPGTGATLTGNLHIREGEDLIAEYPLLWESWQISSKRNLADIDPYQDNFLYPATTNPGYMWINLAFCLKKESRALLYVLNSSGMSVGILVDKVLPAGCHNYVWLSSAEEKRKYKPGYYRIVFETEGYKKSGDVLVTEGNEPIID